MKWPIIALCFVLCLTAGCAMPTDSVNSNRNDTPAEPDPAANEPPLENKPADTEPAAEETQDESEPPAEVSPPVPPPVDEDSSLAELTANTVQATITMEDGATIVLELYPDLAPQSVRNFVYLARSGFYDGLKFHRIMKGFMIQGGDPEGSGAGGPGYTIKGEFAVNGFDNPLSHQRGVISMARQGDPAYDSGGSQFFIMHEDNTFLDGSYAAFGLVVSGMDVVDKLADTPNSGPNGAVAEANKPVIKSITIDSDTELPEPDRL